ncbi:ketoacyl-ACP synthase III [Clostridium sp. MSJ-8]|uniref:beta-ketoacyl-ACP synthase III n=1 Tax=Clostridium sp. MSJ-8 TaxID=2841510 RepID=UPI001C0E95F8|nr:beta-ketoacyl-ACP synthase III [Clostridium sp. MSJ-8]MBU5487768.1 ketoacyl-ACP synthase III [Clostridium sp. MSJ-8]
MKGINIKGIGAYSPEMIVTNDKLSEIVDTSDEWITSRTGIKERRISQGEDTSEVAIKAVNMALDRAQVKPEDVDLIIVATVTPDNFTPSVSCIVQKEVQAKNAVAFDINAACSGFIFALDIGISMMNSNKNIKNAVIVGSEVLSKIIDWNDRSTCVLFGDGSGAVVLSRDDSNEEKLYSSVLKSEGEKGECLEIGANDVENPFVLGDNNKKNKKLAMMGSAVFKFASVAIVDSIHHLLEENNLTLDDVEYIVPHQANYRIIDFAAKKLKISTDKFYLNLDRYGNTSSASIPLALNEMYENGLLKRGMKIIMVGFGGGLTCGAVLIEL